ncbi:hypothetical protein L6452_14186 [Arctium lappa]|uniref:Uncharacterized protein n=1 Tax=Arctium lappa TaxID=4217 RepID=A0ACB9CKF6_ARCLA|nr:hypothetical protein L6452_14186 [Arctium lappa]
MYKIETLPNLTLLVILYRVKLQDLLNRTSSVNFAPALRGRNEEYLTDFVHHRHPWRLQSSSGNQIKLFRFFFKVVT